MSNTLFITGTDTNVGKTYVSAALLNAFTLSGLRTLGLKPVSSGTFHEDSPYNADALSLQKASSIKLAYEKINPFCFKKAIAPHIEANKAAITLTVKKLNEKMHIALNTPADICIIEGAGGWYTPLNETETMADFVIQHHLKTILVVSIQLGCINHAILTQRAMLSTNIPILGWIANYKNNFIDHGEEQIHTLKRWLTIPYLGTQHYNTSINNNLLLRVKNFLAKKVD